MIHTSLWLQYVVLQSLKIRIIAGAIVHATSINCLSKTTRFVKLLITSIIIIYVTTVKIIIIIILGTSEKEIKCKHENHTYELLQSIYIYIYMVLGYNFKHRC